MWLEYELLRNREIPGVFCVSTSFRNEQNPIPGRHNIIFPMFEFESKGTIEDLRKLEQDLCVYLGFQDKAIHRAYDDLANHYKTEELTSEHEMKMQDDFSHVTFIEMFPQKTSPFWNMKKNGEHAHKIDVILHGMETIGSAERSTNPQEMNDKFHTISEGKYGGGIGLTRLMRAMNLENAAVPSV
ncbi:MAG: hypothetical protein HYR95_00435 [Candidatus Colwellbacteria bacterium]|nr:hypothetical protein [Candidatus Colwellbacteria bacterium]